MDSNRYPILKLLFPMGSGIIVGYYAYLPQKWMLLAAPFFVIILPVFGLLLHFRHYKWQKTATIIFQTIFLFFGFFLTNVHYFPNLSPKQESLIANHTDWIVCITDFPAITEKSVKIIANIESSCCGQTLNKKAIFYLKKDSAAQQLNYGDQLLLHTKLSYIAAPKNPFAFNYKQYMQQRSVFFTSYIQAHEWQKISTHPPSPLRYTAKQLQQYFTMLLSQAGMSGDEYSVINAILLGNDDTMNAEIRQSYASAGVSHILCVSGMHVGIIFMILNFLLKPMNFSRKTTIVKVFLLLATIWFYAYITGLSPSVKRAATMFSFVAIGDLLHRNTNIFHSLWASCFILLLFNPLLLFDVGFQLSYLAVLGIVTLQPHLLLLWNPKIKIINYFWQLTTVSISAQFTTFPLSIYYFGQFPNYFLITNLAVMMLSSVVVISGIITLTLSFSALLAGWSAWLLTKEINIMNIMIRFVEQLPGSVTDKIAISTIQLFILYISILMFIWTIIYRKKHSLLMGISCVAILSLLKSADVWRNQQQKKITCYAIQGESAISFNYHGEALLLCDSSLTPKSKNYKFNIQNHEYKTQTNSCFINFEIDTIIPEKQFFKQGGFVYFDTKTLLIVQNDIRYYPTDSSLTIDYILVRSNTKCRLPYMIKTMNIKKVIIDESNNTYIAQEWEKACQTLNIECWNVREQGALIF